MAFRDFLLLFAICVVWGLNLVVTRWAVADMGVPPLFFAALRFLGVALVLVPFLWPRPPQIGRLVLISICMGSAHFALLFMGLRHTEASAVAIAGQLGLPFSTLLSMAVLNEQIGWRRGLGIMLAFAGVLLIAFEPGSLALSYGVLLVVVSAFVASVGGVMMKQLTPIKGLQMQAWIGLFSFAPLFALSAFVEQDQVSIYMDGSWGVWLASAFAILGVSVFGHGGFYTLIKKYEISLLSPLTLMTPIWGVVFGIVLLNEPITARLVLGAVISLSGVFVIAVRRNTKMPEAAFGKRLGAGES